MTKDRDKKGFLARLHLNQSYFGFWPTTKALVYINELLSFVYSKPIQGEYITSALNSLCNVPSF